MRRASVVVVVVIAMGLVPVGRSRARAAEDGPLVRKARVEEQAKKLAKDADPAACKAALKALMTTARRDEAPEVREAAWGALGDQPPPCGDKALVPPLVALLSSAFVSDKATDVRVAAVSAAYRLSLAINEKTDARLKQLLVDLATKDRDVRVVGAAAYRLDMERPAPAVLDAIRAAALARLDRGEIDQAWALVARGPASLREDEELRGQFVASAPPGSLYAIAHGLEYIDGLHPASGTLASARVHAQRLLLFAAALKPGAAFAPAPGDVASEQAAQGKDIDRALLKAHLDGEIIRLRLDADRMAKADERIDMQQVEAAIRKMEAESAALQPRAKLGEGTTRTRQSVLDGPPSVEEEKYQKITTLLERDGGYSGVVRAVVADALLGAGDPKATLPARRMASAALVRALALDDGRTLKRELGRQVPLLKAAGAKEPDVRVAQDLDRVTAYVTSAGR